MASIWILNVPFSAIFWIKREEFKPQIREQMSGPDLHVFTLKFLALKNWFFPNKKYFQIFFWLLFTFILCNFSVQTLKYFQKNFKLTFCP